MLGEFKKDFFEFEKAVLLIDAIVLAGLTLFGQLNLPNLIGLLAGIVLVSLDFYLIIIHSVAAVQTVERAKFKATANYFLRMAIVAVFLVGCFQFAFVNQWIVLIHVFYPKIIFILKPLYRKES